DGGFATVTTPHGSCALKVVVDAGQREGSLFAPIHWSRATASDGSIGELVMAETDPLSGQPEAKATPATIEPCRLDWRGFLVMREVAELPVGTWWARVALAGGTGWLFASNEPPDTWRTRASHLFGCAVELAEYVDARRDVYRAAAFRDGRLTGCLF